MGGDDCTLAQIDHDGGNPASGKPVALKKQADADDTPMIRWSIEEVRRIANKLAQRRIHPAHISHGHADDEHIRP